MRLARRGGVAGSRERKYGPSRRRDLSRQGAERRAAARPCCMAARGTGGFSSYSAGVAMSALPRHRDVVIYDQRGAGVLRTEAVRWV
jgi:hypothetical protein